MLGVLSTTALLFGAIFLGIFYSFIKIFKPDDSKTLIKYVFNIALPCSLFTNGFLCEIEVFNIKYILSYCIGTLITAIIFFFLSKVYLKKSMANSFLNTLSVTQIDGAYFAIPLFILLFNSASYVIVLQVIQNVIFFPLVIFFIDYYSKIEKNTWNLKSSKEFIVLPLKILTTNPFIIASILGLLLGSMQFHLNNKILEFLHLFGKSASSVALFAIGVSFYGNFNKFKNIALFKSFSLLTFGKLIIFPFFTFLIAKIIGLPHELMLPIILLTASPSATHCYVMANRYNLDEDIQTNTIIATTLLSFITISLLIFIFR